MNNNIRIIFIGAIILATGFIVWQTFIRDDFNLPTQSSEDGTQTIVVQDGKIIQDPSTIENLEISEDLTEEEKQVIKDQIKSITTKEIMTTEGVKHSIPLEDVLSGGPGKDGIPSIDEPKFISISETGDFLDNDDIGLAIDIDGVKRFYPFKILVWHEIVNDTINGKKVLVTYCPLCLSGIVFDPVVGDERVEFGVSGRLWNSNLLMYDRKTDSLWSQVLGEAVVGEMTGAELTILPSDQIKYGEWKATNPGGQVLSKDTGEVRIYGHDPYGDYYYTPGVFFPIDNRDNRLPEKAFILGIVIDDKAKAYDVEAVEKVGQIEEEFQGTTIIARYEKEIDAVRLYEKLADGSLERINPFTSFWFTWAAVHPDTELYTN